MPNTIGPSEAAADTAQAVSTIGARFMSDPATFVHGRRLGYEGIEFYLVGRAGALGEVAADVAAAGLVFFNPATVHAVWDRTAKMMPRGAAAFEFAGRAWEWADEHLDDSVDLARLTALTERIVVAAPTALAPLFAGWRSLPRPTSLKARTTHAMNALRELRMARHAAAIVAHGIAVGDAVRHRQPGMIGLFGWEPGEPPADVIERWNAAEAMTDRLVGDAYSVLEPAELTEFVELTLAAAAAAH